VVNALQLLHISKRFGDLLANDDISLTLARGEVLALLGENGAGKSTLMNILFGHYVADQGSIRVFGEPLAPGRPQESLDRGVGMVHQHFTLADNLTVLDNVLLGTESLSRLISNKRDASETLRALSRQFGLAVLPDALVRSLSVGEKQRVEILKALYRGARILILDEPTSVLTPQEVTQLFDTLRQLVATGLSVIFISHKLNEVLAISHRVVVLRKGRTVHECHTAATDKASLAIAMVGRPVIAPRRDAPPDAAQSPPAPMVPVVQPPALSVRSLSATHATSRVALRNVSLEVTAGEIVAIAGVAGNGQRLFADVLSGLVKATRGDVALAGQIIASGAKAAIDARIARIPEDRQNVGVVGDLCVWENTMLPRAHESRFAMLGCIRRIASRIHAHSLVEKFDVRLSSVEQPIRMLSGGNVQKIILGRELEGNPVVIIAAQPTWGLDVGAVAFVHQQLLSAREGGAAIVLISEDLDEVFALADRVAVMSNGDLSPALPAHQWTLQSIGLAMAGTAQSDAARAHAA
jgi:general nucleoside transport system ATP-binding protein